MLLERKCKGLAENIDFGAVPSVSGHQTMTMLDQIALTFEFAVHF